MIKTEKYMAFRRPEFREDSPGFDTIGEVIFQDASGLTVQINPRGFEFFVASDALPIGNDDIRREFGLPPFDEIWPADTSRSGVTRDRVWCFLPGPHYRRPGFILPAGGVDSTADLNRPIQNSKAQSLK